MKTIAAKQLKTYYHLWRETNALYEAWAKAHNISYNALFVLYSLWENPKGCTQTVICNQWLLPKQTVNTILKNFQKQNFVVFTSPIYDGRKRFIRLTNTGMAYASTVIPALKDLEISVMEKLGPERAKAINENTALFIDYFKEGMNNE